jgi:hypothetical protein
VVVPEATPDTTPVVRPIEATLLDELRHVPPVVVLVRVVVAPVHTVLLPPIAAGAAPTVTDVTGLVSEPLVLQEPAPVQVITQ